MAASGCSSARPFGVSSVLDAHGRLGNHDAGDNSFSFQLSQPLGQHAVADVGDGVAQLGVAHPPLQEQLYDRT